MLSRCQDLTEVIWVTKAGNVHMDFSEPSEKVRDNVNVSTWRGLVEEHKSSEMSEVPPVAKDSPSPFLSIVESTNAGEEVLEYTSQVGGVAITEFVSPTKETQNIAAAIAALIHVLPRNQRHRPPNRSTIYLLPSNTNACRPLLPRYSRSQLCSRRQRRLRPSSLRHLTHNHRCHFPKHTEAPQQAHENPARSTPKTVTLLSE